MSLFSLMLTVLALNKSAEGTETATLDNVTRYRKRVTVWTLAYCAYVTKDFLRVTVVLKCYKAISVQKDIIGTACLVTGKQETWDGYKITELFSHCLYLTGAMQ